MSKKRIPRWKQITDQPERGASGKPVQFRGASSIQSRKYVKSTTSATITARRVLSELEKERIINILHGKRFFYNKKSAARLI